MEQNRHKHVPSIKIEGRETFIPGLRWTPSKVTLSKEIQKSLDSKTHEISSVDLITIVSKAINSGIENKYLRVSVKKKFRHEVMSVLVKLNTSKQTVRINQDRSSISAIDLMPLSRCTRGFKRKFHQQAPS